MDESVKIKCRGCGSKVYPSHMGHNENNDLLCKDCLAKGMPIRSKEVEGRAQKAVPKGGIKYKCSSCSYTFYRIQGTTQAAKCPYCSSTNIMPARDSAQNLIEDVGSMEEEKFFK